MRANPSQSDANLMSIQCQSCAAQASIHYQSDAKPISTHQSNAKSIDNPTIHCQSQTNPGIHHQQATHHQSPNSMPIRECQSTANPPLPICQSVNHMPIRQSLTNPSIPHHFRNIIPIHCQSSNQMPICQSNANLPIHHQSDNPRPIGQPDEKSSYPPTIHDQSADTAANLNPSVDPMPILDW